MNGCSPELITLIFEFACADDLGETARRLGLVSKYFRAIAEPIELHSVAISGIKQLRGAVARLNTAFMPTASDDGGRNVTVRGLFISELTKEHAILADKNFENGSGVGRNNFWSTKEGQEAGQFYFEHSDEFWRLTMGLIKKTSPMLKKLALLSSNNWFTWRGSRDFDRVQPWIFDLLTSESHLWRRKYSCTLDRPKVLGVLSGANLPNLVSLTIHHNASLEMCCFGDDGSLFQVPVLPALRRLHIASSPYMYTDAGINQEERAHPFLARLVSEYTDLEELILSDWNMGSVERPVRAIFGPDWQGLLSRGTLPPGKLQSVTLQHGMVPASTFGYGTGYMTYMRQVGDFVRDVERLNVSGLVAQSLTEVPPIRGRTEYEQLFSDWREQCLPGTLL